MTNPQSRLDRFFERAAALGAGGALHPAALLQRLQDAALSSVRDGSIANAFTVRLAAADLNALAEVLEDLRTRMTLGLEELARTRGLRPVGPWSVEFERAELTSGQAEVSASFKNPHDALVTAAAGVTSALTRHSKAVLVVEGLGPVRLTHTPFTLGRAPGSDLVVPDLSISRRHAVIEFAPGAGFSIRDLRSRNGIMVGAASVREAHLDDGTRFALGSTNFELQVTP